MTSSKYSCRSWIIRINVSHCRMICCSTSWHDSCVQWSNKWGVSLIFIYRSFRIFTKIKFTRFDLLLFIQTHWNTPMACTIHTVTLSLIPLSRWINSVVDLAFSDNCCKLCDNSVYLVSTPNQKKKKKWKKVSKYRLKSFSPLFCARHWSLNTSTEMRSYLLWFTNGCNWLNFVRLMSIFVQTLIAQSRFTRQTEYGKRFGTMFNTNRFPNVCGSFGTG